MELYKALSTIVSNQGKDTLKDLRVINILSDYRAYNEFASTKFLLKTIISEGIMAKIFMESQNNDSRLLISTNKQFLVDNYGFKEDLVEYVLNCILYSIGIMDEEPSFYIPASQVSSHNNSPFVQPLNSSSDDGKVHLTFKQIPITGSAELFMKRLESMGFNVTHPYSHEYHLGRLEGTFAGVINCGIIVVGTALTAITCRVIVEFSKHQVWHSIKSEYEKWKDKLTLKYGTPRSYEFFTDPYYEGDGSEMTALFSEHCTFQSYFTDKESEGTVVVRMTQNENVTIIYEDKHNTEINEIETDTVVDNDL